MNTNPNGKDTCCVNLFNLYTVIRKYAIVLIAFSAFATTCAYGQNTTIILNADSNGKSTYVECGTTYYFYDSGGESGNYGNRENFTYTFESCNPVKITFVRFSTEDYSDKLKLYDNGTNETICQGEVLPSTYTATSGKLQISWHSDDTYTYAGWTAKITCTGTSTCPAHTLTYNTTSNCSGTASNAPASVTASGAVVTNVTPTCSLTPFFVGWNTEQYGNGIQYYAGENISLLQNNVTLYAQYSECDQNIITASGDPSESYNVPFCSNGNSYSPRSSYSQMLYTKAQIASASGHNGSGTIQKICFNYKGTADQNMEFDLYMANSTKTNLDTWQNSGLTLVASKNITFSPGWVEIELDNEFSWDGTNNLVIAMHNKTQIGYYTNRVFNCHDSNGTNVVRYQYNRYNLITLNANNYPDGIATGTTSTITLPDLKFCMVPICEPPTFLFSDAEADCDLGSSYNLTTLFTLNNSTGSTATYSCDPAQATISGTTITPLVGGNITITAHIDAYNGKCAADATAILTVNCTEPSFEFSQYGVFCTISNSVSAPSYTTNSTSTSVTYSSSNEAVATVNPSTGVVTGVSEGYTTITANLAASGNFCQKTATFVAYVSPDENCMPFTAGNCEIHAYAYSPFYTQSHFGYSYVQMLYKADELIESGLSAGKINKIAFHYYGHPSSPHEFSQSFRVFIGETTATSLFDSWVTPAEGFMEKFSGSKTFYENSWTYIELTDGFDWDGTSNIVVAINTYGNELPVDSRFCTRNSEQLARYVGKQPSEISGTEIYLNPTTKLPSYGGDHSVYRADIKFCKDASTIILPIELSDFKATCKGNKIEVTWQTESERNNDHYILERSSNAVDFIEIARISGAGNSIETINYSYTDHNPTQGYNYYRLSQIDNDGTRSVSEIIAAKCNTMQIDELNADVYPNPFSNELTIALSNFNGQRTIIEVFDMLGKTIATKTIENPDNYYETTLNLDGFPKAAYSVRISANGATINKLVVKN